MDGFFGIGLLELFLIAILALIVLGPDRLPGAMRQVAEYIRQIRRLGNDFTSQFSDELKALDELNPKRLINEITDPNYDNKTKAKAKPGAKPVAKPAGNAAAKPLAAPAAGTAGGAAAGAAKANGGTEAVSAVENTILPPAAAQGAEPPAAPPPPDVGGVAADGAAPPTAADEHASTTDAPQQADQQP